MYPVDYSHLCELDDFFMTDGACSERISVSCSGSSISSFAVNGLACGRTLCVTPDVSRSYQTEAHSREKPQHSRYDTWGILAIDG